jgi:putative ABC transport system permease protein
MPREFSYPHGATDFPGQPQFASMPRTDLWVPAALTPKQQADPEYDGMDAAVGRLRAGVILQGARAELSAIESRLNPTHPIDLRESQALLVPFLETAIGPVRPLMRLLTAAVCLILVMACGNLASLLMARAANRVHEIGVRTALGAERSRLVRLMLTESLMISAAGGLLALPLTYLALKVVLLFNPGDIPRLDEATPDWPVLLFGLGLSMGAGLVSGILPAVSASRVGVCDLLRQGGRGVVASSLRIRNALVAFQIAGAVVLLAGAGILIRSYLTVQGEQKGFSRSTLTMSILVDPQISNSDPFRREAMERIQNIPGVQAAGSIDDLPLSTFEDKGFLEIEGYARPLQQFVAVRETAGAYFRAMGIPLLDGRYPNDGDISPERAERALAAVVSESFATQYFPGRIAVGHRVRINGESWMTIVGVVGDVRHSSMEEAPQPTVYYQNGLADSVAIRTAVPEAVIRSVRTALNAWNASVTVADVKTMNEYIDQATARRKFQTAALTCFAAAAVILALVGFYSVLSFAVTQRTAEIGVRMALGASRPTVIGMVLGYGLKLTGVGLAIGLGLASLLTRMLASFLYGVRPIDPITFLVVPVFTIAVAAIACIVPAWKAASVDPVSALRQQ